MNSLSDLTSQVGVAVACQALAVPRSSFYRSRQEPQLKMVPTAPPTPSPLELRQRVLNDAFSAHPERFVRKPPSVQSLPEAVWINRPQQVLEVAEEPPFGV
jgi:hypothetical protein